jgi:hypothetical protein
MITASKAVEQIDFLASVRKNILCKIAQFQQSAFQLCLHQEELVGLIRITILCSNLVLLLVAAAKEGSL